MRIDRQRKGTYHLLALAFRSPTPQLLSTLTADEAVDLWWAALALLSHPVPAAGSLYLRPFLAEARTKELASMANDLLVEYCRLFMGPYSLPCAPYGSVYLDGGRVMGPSTVDAVLRYRQTGLQTATVWSEPPDHIAVELEFLVHLSAKYCAAADSRKWEEAHQLLNVQRGFLRDHLGRWGPSFAERLSSAASCHLYRFLGEFLAAWLAFDRALLDALAAALPEIYAPCESGR